MLISRVASIATGRSGDRIPVEARFSLLVQTGPGTHPSSCTMSKGFLLRGYSGRVVVLTTYLTEVQERAELKL